MNLLNFASSPISQPITMEPEVHFLFIIELLIYTKELPEECQRVDSQMLFKKKKKRCGND